MSDQCNRLCALNWGCADVHPTTLVIPIIHTVCVVGGGVLAAAFTLTLFAGGGFHAMRQRLQSELNHLSAEDP